MFNRKGFTRGFISIGSTAATKYKIPDFVVCLGSAKRICFFIASVQVLYIVAVKP